VATIYSAGNYSPTGNNPSALVFGPEGETLYGATYYGGTFRATEAMVAAWFSA